MKKFNLHFGKKPLRRANVTYITGCADKNHEPGIDDGGLGQELVSFMYEECRGKLLQGHCKIIPSYMKLLDSKRKNSKILENLWHWLCYTNMDHPTI